MGMIATLDMNMNISRTVLETKSKNCWVNLAQKITIYTIIPFALIVIFEALIKNLILVNLFNIGVACVNFVNTRRCELKC